MIGITEFFPARASFTAAAPSCRLFDVHSGLRLAGRSAAGSGERPVIIVFQTVLDELCDDLARAAQLRWRRRLQTGSERNFPPCCEALRHGDRAVPVSFHDFLDPVKNFSSSNWISGKRSYLRRVALPGRAARPQAAVIHPACRPITSMTKTRVEVSTLSTSKPAFADRGRTYSRPNPKPGSYRDRKIRCRRFGMPTQMSGYPSLRRLARSSSVSRGNRCRRCRRSSRMSGGPGIPRSGVLMGPVFLDTFQLIAA